MIRLSSMASLLIILSLVTSLMMTQIASSRSSTPGAESPDEPTERLQFSLRPVGDTERSFFDNVEVQPGESTTLEVAVINRADEPVDLRLYKTNATNPNNGGFLAGKEDDDLFGSATWIDLETQLLTVDGRDQIVLPFTVTVPEGTAPGQYISSLIAETADTFAIPGSEQFDQRIRYAMAVSILVPGELQHSFELGEPVIDGPQLSIPIANTGNYLVRPEGTLEIVNSSGDVVLESQVELGTVYAGLDTSIVFRLPTQLLEDDYTINLTLEDPNSGASANLDAVAMSVVEPEETPDYEVVSASVEPNADDIVFANVDVVIENRSSQVASTSVVLEVSRDGEVFEEFPLATNQVFQQGENTYTARYLPETTWEPGTYTFRVVVYAGNPDGSQRMQLLSEDLDIELVVP